MDEVKMVAKLLKKIEKPALFTLIFYMTIRRLLWGGSAILTGNTIIKVLPEYFLWALVIILILKFDNPIINIKYFISAWQRNWVLLTFIFLATISIIWSTNVSVTIYKVYVLIICSAVASYIGLTYTNRFLIKSLTWWAVVIALFVLIVSLLFPGTGTSIGFPYFGAWRGIFWSKNYMGPLMAFGNIVSLYAIFSFKQKIPSTILGVSIYFLTGFLVFQSKCATAIILLVLLNAFFVLIYVWWKIKKYLNMKHYFIISTVLIIIILLIMTNLDFLFGLLNRDTTLTGRLGLWSYLIKDGFSNHPIWGSGFGAAWESNNYRIDTQAEVGWPFPPWDSDNGFVDIFLHLGVVGELLLVTLVIIFFVRAICFLIRRQTILSSFPLMVILFVIIVNSSLSFIFEFEYFSWFLMVCTQFNITNSIQITNNTKL